MSNNVFITYSHPNESAEPANRRRVARYIAIHHRNRSAPTSRIGTGTQTRQIRRLAPVNTQPEQVASLPHDEQPPSLSLRFIPRDHYGFRMDPFSVLPTGTGYIGMAAIDYCEDVHLKSMLHSSVQTFIPTRRIILFDRNSSLSRPASRLSDNTSNTLCRDRSCLNQFLL